MPSSGDVSADGCVGRIRRGRNLFGGAGRRRSTPPALTGPTAETTINDLRAQGYDVAINWVAGNTTSALARCQVVAVHNPNTDDAPPTTFTTVYVDVSCPSQLAPVELGVGIGF